jgi:tryptophanyl-tRNA synthetase
MEKKTIFSGIQPSGDLHIGNYLGAIKQWVNLQNTTDDKFIFCIVDLHAITTPQDPKTLAKKNRELAALYIACGLDPEKVMIFVQSDNPDHPYLSWVFDCITPMGWMERMTQFKDKSNKQGERTSVGLFNYPALMAADILLYDTNRVPVGEDQGQHLELTRDIAEKFNRTYGETFVIPKIMVQKQTARVMSLQNPTAKMSKSEKDPTGTINMLDSADEIRRKIMRAVTDSGNEIVSRPDKPALANLLGIYAELSDKSVAHLEADYAGKSYAQFKTDLAEVVVTGLTGIQERFNHISQDESTLKEILDRGAEKARALSSIKIKTVRQVVGLNR